MIITIFILNQFSSITCKTCIPNVTRVTWKISITQKTMQNKYNIITINIKYSKIKY